MIMQDEWFGHRDPFTHQPVGDKDAWTSWDFLLSNVYQLIEDFTDQHGFLLWEVEDKHERAIIETSIEVDRVEQAIKLKSENKQTAKQMAATPGAYIKPKIVLRKGVKDWPTHVEFFKYLSEKESKEDSK